MATICHQDIATPDNFDLSQFGGSTDSCYAGPVRQSPSCSSIVGLVSSAITAAAVVKRLTGRTGPSLMSGLLLLGYSAAAYPKYIGYDDPQWFGHGIVLLGLLAFLGS